VTSEPTKAPSIASIYSKGLFVENGEEAINSRLPTVEDIRVVTPEEAMTIFGTGANVLDGVTVRVAFTCLEHFMNHQLLVFCQ
jgi:hypothetical protein